MNKARLALIAAVALFAFAPSVASAQSPIPSSLTQQAATLQSQIVVQTAYVRAHPQDRAAMLRLQSLLDQYTQLTTLMSNVAYKVRQTNNTIINNIRP